MVHAIIAAALRQRLILVGVHFRVSGSEARDHSFAFRTCGGIDLVACLVCRLANLAYLGDELVDLSAAHQKCVLLGADLKQDVLFEFGRLVHPTGAFHDGLAGGDRVVQPHIADATCDRRQHDDHAESAGEFCFDRKPHNRPHRPCRDAFNSGCVPCWER